MGSEESPKFDPEDSHHPQPASEPQTKWRRTADDPHVVKLFDVTRPLVQIAPMLHVSDRHFRNFIRILTSKAQLWTEMVVDSTIKHTDDLPRHLGFDPAEHPIVCQLGGSDPKTMAAAAKIVDEWGYDEINVNCGCPSSRVVDCGLFGALLMKNPSLVASICKEMKEATTRPVTIKTRIGVDSDDSLEWLTATIETMRSSGVDHFIMHARPAWLEKKLTPAQNRSIPPLNFDHVFEVAAALPDLRISLNGGIQTLDEVVELLGRPKNPKDPEGEGSLLYGVMIGRAASDKPAFLAETDVRIYREKSNPTTAWSRETILEGYREYVADVSRRCSENVLHTYKHVFPILRPIIGLFHSTKGSKLYRQSVDLHIRKYSADESPESVLGTLMNFIEQAIPDLYSQPLSGDGETDQDEKKSRLDRLESENILL